LVSLIHLYTHYMAADVDISIFSILHSFKTIVTDCYLVVNFIIMHIIIDYGMHILLFIYYNSLEY